jgi:ubiquinone/menaquinone biosynthesis C-methylase UbiE
VADAPDPYERAIYQWDQSYAITRAETLWGDPPVPFVVDIAADLVGGRKVVLELPSGDGRNTIPLAKQASVVLAADTSPRALDLAARRLRAKAVDNVVLLEADVFNLPFASNQIAAILCWDLLGHLPDAPAALTELARVLAPGARLLANVFSLGDSTRGIDMRSKGGEEYIYQDRLYFHYYSEEAARELAASTPHLLLEQLTLTRWTEPPHEGYREYEHEHESWALMLRKRSD